MCPFMFDYTMHDHHAPDGCNFLNAHIYFAMAVAVAAVRIDSESGTLAGTKFVDLVAVVVRRMLATGLLQGRDVESILQTAVVALRGNVESYVLEDSFSDLGDLLSGDN